MFCSNCGAQIGPNPNFCSNCGKGMRSVVPAAVELNAPSAPQQTRERSNGWMIILLVIGGFVAWAVISLSSQQARLEKAYEKDPSLRPGPVVNAPSTGNIAHDRLMGLSAAGQALILGQAVDEGCVGDSAFYMGMYQQEAMWSVGCTNGKSYEVKLAADAVGTTEVLDCSVLKAVAHVNCFVKLSDQ